MFLIIPQGNFADDEVHTDKHPVSCNVEQAYENHWGLYGLGGNVAEIIWTVGYMGGSYYQGADCVCFVVTLLPNIGSK